MDADLLEYLSAIIPAGKIDCAKCGKPVVASEGIKGNSGIYCSETCRLQSEALLIKVQPKAVIIDGWEV